MKKINNIILFFVLFVATSQVFAQTDLDSLMSIIANKNNHDTTIIEARAEFGELKMIYRLSFWDSIANNCEELLNNKPKDNVRKKLLNLQASSINNLGVISSSTGGLEKTLRYFEKGLEINQEINNKIGEAELLSNIGAINKSLGRVAEALDYLNKSFVIYKSLKDQNGISTVLSRIGLIYLSKKDAKNALIKFNENLKIATSHENKRGMATAYGNIALVYIDIIVDECGNSNECRLESARIGLENYIKSLEINEELGNKREIATLYNNIGDVYNSVGDPYCKDSEKECEKKGKEVGLVYSEKSLAIREELKDLRGIMTSLINIGYLKFNMGLLKEAEKFGLRGFQMASKFKMPRDIRNSTRLLTYIYEKQGKGLEALEMYRLQIEMRDSLNSESAQKAVAEQEAKYEYEKQKIKDDEMFRQQLLEEKHIEHKQQIIIYSIVFILLLVVVFLFIIFKRLETTKQQKFVIETQKHEVEEAHKEIRDSINYAERIQRSFLATNELLDNNLKEYFVFFQPKDVVSGDFYWAGKLANNQFAIINADSTGHGVPGAIMSILNISSIEEAIKEGSTVPSEIFNKTRKFIIKRLSKDGSAEGGKDGMDASMISFDFENNKFSYAAAQNPIWVMRNNELIEIKGEKMPIGKHDNDGIPFVGGEFETQKGDVIYTLTDGFQDQFGGEKGKKFKVKPFKNYLISIAHLPMQEQRKKLNETFSSWKGEEEQVDDVCIIGVRV